MFKNLFSNKSFGRVIKPIVKAIYLSSCMLLLSAFATNVNTGPGSAGKEKHVPYQTTDFRSLFNEKDLTGWGYLAGKIEEISYESFNGKSVSKEGRFKVIKGILTVNPDPDIEVYDPKYITLWTEKEYPGDFILRVEFRASKNADSGIFIRGMQLQCRDYLVAGPYRSLKNYKAQDWNTIEIVVKNNVAHCTCNDEVLEEALNVPAKGHVGLEADRGQMEYRNIRIKELK